jgi:simple sugar transport system ATP-binding protein
VDVGSIEFIHNRVVHERDVGTAVLLVSSELDEVQSLADRIAVMYQGKILAVVPPDTPREEIGLLMAGVTADQARAPEPAGPSTGDRS